MKIKLKLKGKSKEIEEEGNQSWPNFADVRSQLSSPAFSTVTAENSGDQDDKFVAMVSKFPQFMKLKVVRKRRSKHLSAVDSQISCSSAKYEPSASDSVSSGISSGTTSSAISSGSTLTNATDYHYWNHLFSTPAKRRPDLSSAHMRGRADAILRILYSEGCASEVKIRELLGDSPSTSKALRLLLSLEQVKRCGAGGRIDPYIYMIA